MVDGEKYGVIYGAIYPTSYGTNYMSVQILVCPGLAGSELLEWQLNGPRVSRMPSLAKAVTKLVNDCAEQFDTRHGKAF